MSKMVEVLVKRELLNREVNPHDRRHVRLTLTRAGQTVVRRVRTQVEKNMQVHLDDLNNKEQKQVLEALLLLQKVFSSNRGEVVA
jgi:DNA-binding MarR family transcriptional regulator